MSGYEIKDERTKRALSQLGKLKFEGNVMPHSWFKYLRYPSGKAHVNAIVILSDIVYWYRPIILKNGTIRKKYKAKYLQKTHAAMAESFGLSIQQVRDALDFLVEKGIVTKHVKKRVTNENGTLGNVLYLELHVDRLKEITLPLSSQEQRCESSELYTENTTENSDGEDLVESVMSPTTKAVPWKNPMATSEIHSQADLRAARRHEAERGLREIASL